MPSGVGLGLRGLLEKVRVAEEGGFGGTAGVLGCGTGFCCGGEVGRNLVGRLGQVFI